MLPEAVAYAGIAGLPPQRAILAAIAGCLAYAAIGRSRFAIVSPTSSSAAILAACMMSLPGAMADKLGLVTILIGLAGIIFVIASLMRLGVLAAFISRPVLRGFAFGLAITIVIRQLPVLAGISVASADIFHTLYTFASAFRQWHAESIAVGLVALAALLILRRFPALPGSFLVLAAGIAASYLLDLKGHGVSVVGVIDLSMAWPNFSTYGRSDIIRLLPFAFPLAFILLAESWGTIRSLALRHGDVVDANRELGALGAANLASALVQGMPVGAGFSAGVANEAAGAASRWASVAAAVCLGILVFSAHGLVAMLPHPVLAAVVIAALMHALDPAPLLRLWHLGRDQYVALAAIASVLLLGVLNGLLVAVLLSFAIFIRRLALSDAARLGRLGDSHDFVDISRHDDAKEITGIVIWRPTQPLFFGNAETVLAKIAADTKSEPRGTAVIVSLEETFELDTTALEALVEFDTAMSRSGNAPQYARVHDHVRDLLMSGSGGDLINRSSYSVDDAVTAIDKKEAKEDGSPASV
jgi:MFS superfamily sulfate permease-like transporter